MKLDDIVAGVLAILSGLVIGAGMFMLGVLLSALL